MSMKAVVKSCMSGDTLVLRGRPGPQGQLPVERVLHIAEVTAPRLGTSQRDDEPFAFESREFLRSHAIGKEVSFTSTHSLPITDGSPRDIGTAQIGGQDIATELLKNGWAKLKEIKREATDEDIQRRTIEADAKNAGRGQWNPDGPAHRTVYHTMPNDSQGFINEWKGKPIDAIVEQVRDGTTLRVRLLLSSDMHQFINIALAGARSPRASGKEGEVAEPFGEEAKYFVETRLLQRHVSVTLLSLPTPAATPFSTLANGPAAAATLFIGTVMHPVGNIADHLVGAGLAKVVDWHAGMLAQHGGMEKLRAAEKVAKENRLKLYGAAAPVANGSGTHTPVRGISTANKAQFEGQVVRIWSGDQISVYDPEAKKERRVQLSSVRGPKTNEPKQASYAVEAKEFLRKRLIGNTVSVNVDFIRPKEGEYEERECATIRHGPTKANVAEQLIEKGLATVVRHKRDDENRSPDYDKLMAAEQTAVTDTRGLHSGKEIAVPKVVNISDTHTRANAFLAQFKRAGRVSALVDFVAAGSRFKLILSKENQSLTFVLAGIRAPRSARNPSEKSEPFGTESLEFSSRHYLQRDVEVQFDSLDKSGGFIGTMYYNKTENVALNLVREGLATVHAYSAEGLSWSKQLFEAEEEAQKEQKNIWKDYVADAVVEATDQSENGTALKADYLDVIVSDVKTSPQFSFSVQLLNNDGIATLEKLMHDFSLHHRTASGTPGFTPRNGDLVSARFSGDDGWYRAKVRKSAISKKECDVTFIDYGNQETVPFSRVRPLDPQFRSLPGQAQEARLSFVRFPDPSSEYYDEAMDRFKSLCEGRKLIANIDAREGPLLHLRLMDPSDSSSTTDPSASINSTLVREGFCIIDRKGCKYLNSYAAIQQRLRQDTEEAKRSRSGMYEFGKGKDKAVDGQAYDPEQDPEMKRQIREGYRDRLRDIEEQAKDFKTLDVAALTEGVRNADISFVRAPQEALLDSRLLTTVSHLSAAKAKDLKHDGGGFDTDDFISKLKSFLGGNRIDVQADDDDEDAADREIELSWDKLGWKALGRSRRGLGLDFMLGPLDIEAKQRVQKQRVKAEKIADEEVRPQQVSAEELNARDEAETSKIVADLGLFLQTLKEPINLFELIVNPDSFAQSVENLFYVSFLVRLGEVAIDLNDDDIATVFACEPPSAQDFEDGVKKNQSMWEFDEETWKLAIETFNITKPFIKTRPIPPESSYRFYGS
ncbi:hypothetical protein FRB97_007930 [Tulasnella sp. 331]|nr:hypothetical protein FRB97_007930 [Tulasnella sp. 331]